MTYITDLIIWWTGAVLILAALAALTMIGALVFKMILERLWIDTLRLMQLRTARYWVQRMESEGLTICRADYRRMVAERNPKTTEDFARIEREERESRREED